MGSQRTSTGAAPEGQGAREEDEGWALGLATSFGVKDGILWGLTHRHACPCSPPEQLCTQRWAGRAVPSLPQVT